MADPYELLGVSRLATAEEIKKAFRRAALVHHPDKGGDAAKFGEVRAAYDLLSDPERRARVDLGDDGSGIVSEATVAARSAQEGGSGPCPVCGGAKVIRVGVKGNSTKILFWQTQPCPKGCK
jgi:curved DNA-binding protein CbpA